MGGRQSDEPAAMSLYGNDATGSAGHARGLKARCDIAGKLYAGWVTTGVVTTSGLNPQDLTKMLSRMPRDCAYLVGLAKFNSPFSGHDRGMGDKSRNQGAKQVCCLGAVRVMALAYIAIAVRAKKMAARPILAMARSSQRMLKPAAHSTA